MNKQLEIEAHKTPPGRTADRDVILTFIREGGQNIFWFPRGRKIKSDHNHHRDHHNYHHHPVA